MTPGKVGAQMQIVSASIKKGVLMTKQTISGWGTIIFYLIIILALKYL
jgi:hypothetical protein